MDTDRCLTFSDSRLMHISGGSNFISLSAQCSHQFTLMLLKAKDGCSVFGSRACICYSMRPRSDSPQQVRRLLASLLKNGPDSHLQNLRHEDTSAQS